jgi:GNAT superfamily N-acetyltransferase
MSLVSSPWASYVKELDDVETYETTEGFVLYKIKGEECYIQDIYVYPEHRTANVATKLANYVTDLAKKSGCKHLTGSVRPTARNSTISLLVLLGYGMKLHSSINNLIYFHKSLEE